MLLAHPLSSELASNQAWAKSITDSDASYFPTLSTGQAPHILWIGCSDSRVPETTLLGLKPGQVFVHRNIANILPPTDLSSQSVIEFAVGKLGVQHIIVCGHTSCGGCAGALANKRLGKIDLWLQPLRQLRADNAGELDKLDGAARGDRLAELNVQQGVKTVRQNPDVIDAAESRGLQVHGMIFDLKSGELRSVDTDEGEHVRKSVRDAFQCS